MDQGSPLKGSFKGYLKGSIRVQGSPLKGSFNGIGSGPRLPFKGSIGDLYRA